MRRWRASPCPMASISSAQLRALATIARDYDRPDPELLRTTPRTSRSALGEVPVPGGAPVVTRLKFGYGHFTTRTNVQFNWIPIDKSADVMELLASVDMHGIQTSGNAIRNITTDAARRHRASTRSPIRARSRKSCASGARCTPSSPSCRASSRSPLNGAKEDRAALGWYDIGLQLVKNDAGELGFQVLVGGGMGRTPIIGTVVREFLPWQHLLNYLEAVHPRLQPVRPPRQRLEGAHQDPREGRGPALHRQGGRGIPRRSSRSTARPHTITQAEYDRVAAQFVTPAHRAAHAQRRRRAACTRSCAPTPRPTRSTTAGCSATCCRTRTRELRAVTLSFKRLGQAPGDATADQLDDRRRPGRPLLRRRSARHARTEPAAALGAPGRPARAVGRGAQGRAWRRPTSAC